MPVALLYFLYKNTSMDDNKPSTANANRLGTVLAATAILVQAPRLVLTILAADRLPVADQAEQILLSVAAMGTAVSVTGGGIYIAHAALTAPRWRLALGIAWLMVLTASAGLVAPAIAARLAGQELHEVVNSPALRAAWAVLAALAHELTAAGCMLAAAASSKNLGAEALELRLYAERDAALERLQLAQERVALAEQRAERAEDGERAMSELWDAALEIPDQELLSVPEPFACEWCGRSFKTKQARGGHLRTCPSRPSAEPRPVQGES